MHIKTINGQFIQCKYQKVYLHSTKNKITGNSANITARPLGYDVSMHCSISLSRSIIDNKMKVLIDKHDEFLKVI